MRRSFVLTNSIQPSLVWYTDENETVKRWVDLRPDSGQRAWGCRHQHITTKEAGSTYACCQKQSDTERRWPSWLWKSEVESKWESLSQHVDNFLHLNSVSICTHSHLPPPPLTKKYAYFSMGKFLVRPSWYSLHCKKRLAIFPSPAGMSLTKLSLGGNTVI